MSAGDADDFTEAPSYKKFTFQTQNTSSKRAQLDSVLRDLGIDDSSDEDDDIDINNEQG